MRGFDAVWVVPGSPYRSEAGVLSAIRTAREEGIPFLGTCGGFQHALPEYARHECGLTRVAHAENEPDAEDLLIEPLACSLIGHEATVVIEPGSLAQSVMNAERSVERYFCAYGPTRHLDTLRAHGLRFSGHDEDGHVRIAELPGHPFFLATLFQPEPAGDGSRPHPVVRAFARAAVEHATRAAVGQPTVRAARRTGPEAGPGRSRGPGGPGTRACSGRPRWCQLRMPASQFCRSVT